MKNKLLISFLLIAQSGGIMGVSEVFNSHNQQLFDAVIKNNVSMVSKLLKDGANVNARYGLTFINRSDSMVTPLMVAAINKNAPMIIFLLQNKADISCTGMGGQNALDWYLYRTRSLLGERDPTIIKLLTPVTSVTPAVKK